MCQWCMCSVAPCPCIIKSLINTHMVCYSLDAAQGCVHLRFLGQDCCSGHRGSSLSLIMGWHVSASSNSQHAAYSRQGVATPPGLESRLVVAVCFCYEVLGPLLDNTIIHVHVWRTGQYGSLHAWGLCFTHGYVDCQPLYFYVTKVLMVYQIRQDSLPMHIPQLPEIMGKRQAHHHLCGRL